MCNSAAVAGIGQVVGGILGAGGQLRAANAEADRLEFEQAKAENNAALAEQDIFLTQEEAGAAKEQVTLEIGDIAAQARVGAAAGNVVLDTGSIAEFEQEAAQQAARERGSIQQEAEAKKTAFENERRSLLAEAQLLRKASKFTRRQGRLSAGATFFGGATSGASTALRASERRSTRADNPQ